MWTKTKCLISVQRLMWNKCIFKIFFSSVSLTTLVGVLFLHQFWPWIFQIWQQYLWNIDVYQEVKACSGCNQLTDCSGLKVQWVFFLDNYIYFSTALDFGEEEYYGKSTGPIFVLFEHYTPRKKKMNLILLNLYTKDPKQAI